MASWLNMNFQNANFPMMIHMIMFHEYTLMFIIMITLMILYLINLLILNKLYSKNIYQHQMIESIWTILPSMILICLAIPSIKLLYMTDEIIYPNMTIKVTGLQWYWNFEYSDFNNINFDSFMINNTDQKSWFRLLDTDNIMTLPMKLMIRFIITSNDVIHSFTIPSLGLKIDAIPGRLNQTFTLIYFPGMYFGQCSEIWGINHSFMPITIESTNYITFVTWIKNF